MKPEPLTGHLLIVDDDEAVTQTFARMLTLEGHDVRTANSAEDGLRKATTSKLDAIILDMRMPLINGLGFLYRLRAREGDHHTPVVIVTGDYALEDDVAAELRFLGAEVRFKPLWLEDLVELARNLLREGRDGHQPPLLAS
jgi:two-component system nitrogen regulation response regulator GlnG